MRELGAIETRVKNEMTAALKAGDKRRAAALRLLLAALKKERIDAGGSAGEEAEIAVLKRERKRRLEALELYQKAGRDELAEQERYEEDVLAAYLPEELSPEAIEQLVNETIAETGATSARDLGKVMGLVMKRVAGRADGSQVNAMVRAKLGG